MLIGRLASAADVISFVSDLENDTDGLSHQREIEAQDGGVRFSNKKHMVRFREIVGHLFGEASTDCSAFLQVGAF